jgi:hypothetical protein
VWITPAGSNRDGPERLIELTWVSGDGYVAEGYLLALGQERVARLTARSTTALLRRVRPGDVAAERKRLGASRRWADDAREHAGDAGEEDEG